MSNSPYVWSPEALKLSKENKMRELIIKKIIEFALEFNVPHLDMWFITDITVDELDYLADEELIEVLIHVCTYDEEYQ